MNKARKIRNAIVLSLVLSLAAPEVCPQLMPVGTTVNAASKVVQDTLVSGKTYKYNLDKSGTKETVKFVKEETEATEETPYEGKVTLYVNNKVVYSVKLDEYSDDVRIVVQDTDKTDKQMEILVFQGYFQAWAGNLNHIYYYRYKNGKTSKVQDLEKVVESKYGKNMDWDAKFGQLASIHPRTDKKLVSVDGKGTLTYKVCLYFDRGRLDYAHFYDKLTLKKGKFVKSKTKSFKLTDEEDYFASKGKNKVYKKAGGSKVAFTLKNNEKFYRTGIYRSSKSKVYIKIKTKSGKTGYIKASSVKLQEYGTFHV